jgi:hypothetical protein
LAPSQWWYLDIATQLKGETVGIGTSIFLIAVGAILRFAVTATVSGINIATVGTILIVVGIVGLLISLLYMTMWSDRTRHDRVDRTTAAPPADREVVRERY